MTAAAGTGSDVTAGQAAVGVRELRWQDLPDVVSLERDLFPGDAWSEASWWAELAARPRRDYVVLQEQDHTGQERRLIGYGGLDLGGEVADVMTVAVDPRCQGRGLGGLLLAELERRAARGGARWLVLEVRADNAAATALYRSRGFVPVRTRARYYPDGADALVMRLEVGP
ncbi:ribosomal protein S18-alanine N-acetyltransferase [Ornithinicoccus halotolerans]|uniref:ribosomal protein S18-alanine N-acetyltransferase n=1 Tax=Ornithinicoccus halotolerans TaxID=1748220 RepID=UPI001E2E0D42|nr:ribosomal protein S18-alanine N-acetyltransferase [Ornithinicoccus halotolerans]